MSSDRSSITRKTNTKLHAQLQFVLGEEFGRSESKILPRMFILKKNIDIFFT